MIFDKIENLDRYKELSFIKDNIGNRFQKGKFEIDGEQKFGIGLEYETKKTTECLWEAHRKYLDIHILLEGEEIVEISDIKNMKSTKEYEDDYELFDGQKQQEIVLRPGCFLVLYPNEVHKTCVKVKESVIVKKHVYKHII